MSRSGRHGGWKGCLNDSQFSIPRFPFPVFQLIYIINTFHIHILFIAFCGQLRLVFYTGLQEKFAEHTFTHKYSIAALVIFQKCLQKSLRQLPFKLV